MFVLAAGGIENARLLLASRSVMPSGLGNAHDNVGRYFMEHPHARGGRVADAKAWPLLKAFGRRHRVGGRHVAALIAPAPVLQAERSILNSSLTIVARQPERAAPFWGMRAYSAIKHETAPSRAGRALWMATKRAAGLAQRVADPLRPWLLHKAGRLDIALLVRAEQAPDPDSRLTLGAETDALGMPRARLDWRLSEIDVRSVDVLVRTLGGELERLGLGSVVPASWLADPSRAWKTDPLISAHPIGGYHHMGTTRMSDDPRAGVTDARTRVHGIGNFYVAGSSLFPTSGWANPTLTIVALALRTADHVSAALGAKP
jgi:choline dehydrogenase-like flavoprotein